MENKLMHKKKLLIVCPYPEGVAPSQRLKYEQYFEAFNNDGWTITVKPFINSSFWKLIYSKGHLLQKVYFTIAAYLQRFVLLSKVSSYDVVYVHLWATPFGPPLYEKFLRKLAKRLIYDIDDLVYLHGTDSKAHPIVTLIKGRNKPIYLMKHADHVITCTPYLDTFVKQYNQKTTDISSTVDTEERYQVYNKYETSKEVTIGWSGSLSTSKYFYLLTNVFTKLREKYSFKLIVMGDPNVRIAGLNIEALSWKESYEMDVLQRFDIGVYPLPDEQWVYGKSGLKAIQYMALGIPTVATAIGANFRVIENGVTGFLVSSEDEWIEKLGKLIEDPKLRKDIGLAGRKKVEQTFSIKANKDNYIKILNGM